MVSVGNRYWTLSWQEASCHRRLEIVMSFRTFLTVAIQRTTVLRAIKIALIVGLILVAVNEGSALLHGDMDMTGLASAAMNFIVPYCVSTVSTVLAHAETKASSH